jgi:hypothetical protein
MQLQAPACALYFQVFVVAAHFAVGQNNGANNCQHKQNANNNYHCHSSEILMRAQI